MNTFFTEVRQTFVPRGEVKHGPLPPLVIALIVIAIIAVTTGVLSRTDPIWVRAS